MCGIFALYDGLNNPAPQHISAILQTMVHRGPDDEGIYCNGPVALGHRRLSIIDIDGGAQPIWNEDHTLAIICNGEIYDHLNLRRDLQKAGHTFTTNSDSEVLLHLFEDKGTDAFKEINGMFALTLYDAQEDTLYLARDRFGQKPLFYSHHNTQFACASGPSQLQKLSWVNTTINYKALNWYLQYQYLPTPESIYQDVYKLPPGSYGIFKESSFSVHTYYTPTIQPSFTGSFQEALSHTHLLLKKAITRRLVSDVPVGIFLSGGLDSSLIARLASDQRTTPLDTFSIGFKEAKYDERQYAQQVATTIGSTHHFLEVDPSSWNHLVSASKFFEEPFADSSLLPTMLLSAFATKYVTVALGGDGADELAGGYYRYQVMAYAQLYNRIPLAMRNSIARTLQNILPSRTEERTFWGRIQRLLDIAQTDGPSRYLELISRFKAHQRDMLYNDCMREHQQNDLAPLGNIDTSIDIRHWLMQTDMRTYLPNDILVKVDRASMAHSLEVRAPFLDPELASFLTTLPPAFTAHYTCRKRILHALGHDILPSAICKRPKMGFGVPLAQWFRHQWKSHLTETLLDSPLLRHLFTQQGLETLINHHLQEKTDNSYQLFALTMLSLWDRQRT